MMSDYKRYKQKEIHEYSENKINYTEFKKLIGFIELQILLENLHISRDTPPQKVRFAIQDMYYLTEPSGPFLPIFNKILKDIYMMDFVETLDEYEIIELINEIIRNKHVKGLSKISSINDLSERDAAIIVRRLLSAWVLSDERFMQHLYFDFENGRIRNKNKLVQKLSYDETLKSIKETTKEIIEERKNKNLI